MQQILILLQQHNYIYHTFQVAPRNTIVTPTAEITETEDSAKSDDKKSAEGIIKLEVPEQQSASNGKV
jgi:hypothetical protein